MFNPGVAFMLYKIDQAERLKEAEERRLARIAWGDAQQPIARVWTVLLPLSVFAVALGVLVIRPW